MHGSIDCGVINTDRRLILVLALLILPAASAAQFVNTIKRMMILSAVLSIAITTTGMIISYEPDLPSGSTIIIVAGFVYVLAILGQNIFNRIRTIKN